MSLYPTLAATLLLTTTFLQANKNCEPEPGVCYSTDDCECYSCLGPDNTLVNAPVRPKTCNGDFAITIAGIYWTAHQDGMQYAIRNDTLGNDAASVNPQLNNLIDAKYLSPDFKWDFGFKLGLGYNTTCDGWDIGAVWTWYRDSASTHVEAEEDDNMTLLPLWTAFQFPSAGTAPILFSTDIETFWKLELNLVDFELGREYWTSKYLSLRPHAGLRYGSIDQKYQIENRGGSFNDLNINKMFNDQIDIKNKFHGVGIIAGLDTIWHLGCGWGIFGNFAFSTLVGRFKIHHNEKLRDAETPFAKIPILETKENFRATRSTIDLALGLQYATLFCDCAYGLTFALGWEHHLFFDQNQMQRVVRVGGEGNVPLNNTGENIFHQRRGDLGTQGWTLTAKFEF